MGKSLVLAVDLGGTLIRVALCDERGSMLRREAQPTQAVEGQEGVIERISDMARQVLPDRETVVGMGVSVPGPVDPETGVLLTPPNLPGWRNVPLKDILKKRFEVPVFLGNDANLAALGEHRFGAGRGVDDLIYMTVGTGVGGGIISRGRLFLGADGLAGEVGHMSIVADGPRCNCGNVGCLEALASGPAIARRAQERMEQGETTLLRRLAGGEAAQQLTCQMVEEAAKRGDHLCQEVIEEAGLSLGVGVLNLVHIFNPRLIIIGGGVSKIGAPIFEPVRRIVSERTMPNFTEKLHIVPAALGDDAALLGAWALAAEQRLANG